MKRLSRIVWMLLLVSGGRLQASPETDAVQAQVCGFYRWYVHALNAHPAGEPRKAAVVHRYVSARFLKEITRQASSADGLEADPFLSAQDWDPGWEKNIRVNGMDQQGVRWKVQVELSGKEMAAHRLNLILVREDGNWKIDQVSDGDKH